MSLCVQCAQPTLGPSEFCAYHVAGQADDWATGNRIMCDFLHRGILSASADRPTEFRADTLDVADTLEAALTP